MTTAAVITGYLNGIFLALTPVQRWEAARGFNGSFIDQRWFILIAIAAIVILAVLLGIVSFNRTKQQRKTTEKLFVEYAGKKGLTARERQILLSIASKAGLKRNESIFTLPSAFDRGATEIIEESLGGQEATKESKQLETELFFLREKLGFKKRFSSPVSGNTNTKSQRLSSKQIPVSRKLSITSRKKGDLVELEGTVVENNNDGLSIKLETPAEIAVGELWCVRYSFGASVWEFDASVLSYDDGILILTHSCHIRFINRRQFLRVEVKKPAFIARFPFAKDSEPTWGPPEFVPAVVTELGGPGLRIEASIEVKVGDRVLIMFELDMAKERDSIKNPENNEVTTVLKIIEDVGIVEEIGEVRRTEDVPEGLSIGVELTSLSDTNVNELIRATNVASIRKVRVKDDDEQVKVDVDEPAAV